MRKIISLFLAAIMLLTLVLIGVPTVYASAKTNTSRAIAIVFDNSGSMYADGDQAWCRATYAMEVFASMLNVGDVLQIYPMHPITVEGKNYSMNEPFQITDSAQASKIRDIFTDNAVGTPIESIDCAVNGLKALDTEKKYLIVLTDGGTFSKNGSGLSEAKTKSELDKRITENAGSAMTVMYLGIGSEACVPDTRESENFIKRQAVNTADVLSMLTDMCNLIFGRDTLPKSETPGKIEFDISMSKLIVFVQGENISNLKITSEKGDSVEHVSKQQTKYSTKGAGNYKSTPDTSLHGMIVTYEDLSRGNYTVDYDGTATSVEVYYEPNADLDFVFTDSDGNIVDPQALYEGDYKVSFGMKDAMTGELISSDLLGSPQYRGNYYINGQGTPIEKQGYSGEVPISLKMDDTFKANLTVTYLGGYTKSKDSSDFGWPDGGIKVLPRPAGDLKLEITGGDESYSVLDLESGNPYIAKVYYQGNLLTGEELKKVHLWESENSNVGVRKDFADDHYDISLCYKENVAPIDTVCGECIITINADYTAPGSDMAQAQTGIICYIDEDTVGFDVSLELPEDYIIISKLEESEEITARLTLDGKPMMAEEFAGVEFGADCDGISYTVTPDEQTSSYIIKLHGTDGLSERRYSVKVTATYTDPIGRTAHADDKASLTLSNMPLWLKWVIGLALLLILIIVIWLILHIKVLPKYMHTTRKLSNLNFDGEDVTQSTNFHAEIKKKNAKVQGQYAGKRFGISMEVTPGKESYLYKSQKRRSALVKVTSVKKFGAAKVNEAVIGNVKYIADEDTGKLAPAILGQKPFKLTNGAMVRISGTMQDAGKDKDFELTSKLNFKKK